MCGTENHTGIAVFDGKAFFRTGGSQCLKKPSYKAICQRLPWSRYGALAFLTQQWQRQKENDLRAICRNYKEDCGETKEEVVMIAGKNKLCPVLLAGSLALVGLAWPQGSSAKPSDEDRKVNDRIRNSGTVLKEVLNVPDDIPRELLNKARCIIVLPSVTKAAFVVGGEYGRGVMTCRTGHNYDGGWGAPVMMALEGGSFGLQIGGEATDFVILVMNNRGADSILHSKVKLGADASIAAGPKGRQAEADTDVAMRAEMLSYSRARGVFAGVSLEGTTLRPDHEADKRLYGKDVSPENIVKEPKVEAPESAHALISTLQQASPHLRS